MSPVLLFFLGVFVFLITVYGTVAVGGLLLTGRQLDDDPNLAANDQDGAGAAADSSEEAAGLRRLVPADY